MQLEVEDKGKVYGMAREWWRWQPAWSRYTYTRYGAEWHVKGVGEMWRI